MRDRRAIVESGVEGGTDNHGFETSKKRWGRGKPSLGKSKSTEISVVQKSEWSPADPAPRGEVVKKSLDDFVLVLSRRGQKWGKHLGVGEAQVRVK